ncbi:MAG: fibronectin type III domain-containing protein, partial [Cyclobacteriaceae bacterium]|nr:fibronectin type III domain-containing protein [Cyclobacteriaceae bacterium HetDA_MAG_MS6]
MNRSVLKILFFKVIWIGFYLGAKAQPMISEAATNVTTTSFQANWEAYPGAPSTQSYVLDVATNSSFTNKVTGYDEKYLSSNSITAYQVSGLEPGKTYYYRVKLIFYPPHESPYSSTIIVQTTPLPVPNPNHSSITDDSFVLSWSALSGITSYRVEVNYSSSFPSGGRVPGYNNLTLSGTSLTVDDQAVITPDTEYHYRVKAENSEGQSAYSAGKSLVTKPFTPTVNNASSIGTTSFTVSWSSSGSTSNYYLDVATNSSFTNKITGYNNKSFSGSTTSHQVLNLTAGTRYYYRVRKKSPNNPHYSVYSSSKNSWTKPNAPNPSSTNVATASFTLSWPAVSGATGYEVDVNYDASFNTNAYVSGYQNKQVSGTSVNVTGISTGTKVYYRVRAKNSGGTSSSSTTKDVTTKPVAPVALQEDTKTSSSFRARWNSVTGATSYRLDVSTNSNFTNKLPGYDNKTINGTNHTIPGLTQNVTYYYRVRALGTGGASSNSNVITANTMLAAPITQSATGITKDQFTARWNSVNGATDYLLTVVNTSTSTPVLTGSPVGNVTSKTMSGLSANDDYIYFVKSKNSQSTSVSSSTVNVRTAPTTPTVNNASSIGATSFTVSWSSSGSTSNYY